MPELEPILVDSWNVAFHHDVDALIRCGHVNPASVAPEYLADGLVDQPGAEPPAGLGGLLVGFFHYFGYEFDFGHQTVRASAQGHVRLGSARKLTGARKGSVACAGVAEAIHPAQVCIRTPEPLSNSSKQWSKPVNIEGEQCTAASE